MSWPRLPLLLLAAATLAVPRPAAASCPDGGPATASVCRPHAAMLMPTAAAMAYAPREGEAWYGGGVELVLLTWSDNAPSFGPSQGKVRFSAGLLGSSAEGAGGMALYRGGAAVSFERSANRRFLIPYFAADVGGLWTRADGRRWFVGSGVGVYLLYLERVIVDVEGGWVLPFSKVDELAGPRAQLAVSFSLW